MSAEHTKPQHRRLQHSDCTLGSTSSSSSVVGTACRRLPLRRGLPSSAPNSSASASALRAHIVAAPGRRAPNNLEIVQVYLALPETWALPWPGAAQWHSCRAPLLSEIGVGQEARARPVLGWLLCSDAISARSDEPEGGLTKPGRDGTCLRGTCMVQPRDARKIPLTPRGSSVRVPE
eukprot:scaffold13781_cov93-Phaeocystis_antarctica.AAC.6